MKYRIISSDSDYTVFLLLNYLRFFEKYIDIFIMYDIISSESLTA